MLRIYAGTCRDAAASGGPMVPIFSDVRAPEAEGKGAVSLDGRLIDYASIRQAEVLVEKALSKSPHW
jgi:hypothetical protein